MDQAIRRVKNQIRPAQYRIFDLYVVKEWSVPRVVKTLKVNRAQIYLSKHRVSKLIKIEVSRLEAELNATLLKRL